MRADPATSAGLLQERTGDGYVFRVDLRLRPDPGVDAAGGADRRGARLLRERRPELGAGGVHQGARLRRRSGGGRGLPRRAAPFIWRTQPRLRRHRRHPFDQAADPRLPADGAIAAAGADLKLGRGGIREIEFFVQTQQLILGGRHRTLRVPPHAGRAGRRCARAAGSRPTGRARELDRGLRDLRALEHRVQMIADEQTHRCPRPTRGAARIAALRASRTVGAVRRALSRRLKTVRRPLRRAVRPARAAVVAARQPGVHRGRGRSGDLATLKADGLRRPASRRGDRPRLAPRPHPRHPHRARRASCLPGWRRGCWTPLAATGEPRRAPSPASTASFAACRRACSCSRCSWPNPSCSS